MTAPKPGAKQGNPNFLKNPTNQDDYIICSFDLYDSELKRLKQLCPQSDDLGGFVEKALRAYLKRPDNVRRGTVHVPDQDFSGPRTRLFVRLPRELHARAMDLWNAEPVAEAVSWYVTRRPA